ncbi:hypothetical protein ACWFRB_09370 [Rhodococcus sp. NPDC055112]
MTPSEVLAAHRPIHSHVCGCRWGAEGVGRAEASVLHAAHVLDALTNTGHAVVTLPEPTDRIALRDGRCARWDTPFYDVRIYNHGLNILADDFEHEAAIEEMEQLGLALLAGAAQARRWSAAAAETEGKA